MLRTSLKSKMAAPSGKKFPDFLRLKVLARDDLTSLLDQMPGRKDLVIDTDLMKPLDRIANVSVLKQRGVDKIFKFDNSLKSMQGCEQRIYLVRPRMTTMKSIADHINSDKNINFQRKYNIIFVPRKLHTAVSVLEYEGVMGYVTLSELRLDFIPLDKDVLSLELPEFFKTFYLESDQTWIHTVAKSLVRLQALMGEIGHVHCIGKGAKMTNDVMNYLMDRSSSDQDFSRHEIGSLILIDRDVDYVTPLCSQLTYEGLLDETFGIKCGTIEFGPEVTGKQQTAKLLLNSDDQIFEDVRNRHFSNVLGYLSSKAKSLQQDFDKRHDLKSVGDMKDFVANELRRLKEQKAVLSHHIGACEQILGKKTKGGFEDYLQTEHSLLEGTSVRDNVSYIEELIFKQDNMLKTLKLICLLSLTQNGITPSTYKSLKTQYLQSHGFEQLVTFSNLKSLGILTEQEAGSQAATPLNKVTSGVAAMTRRSTFKSLCKKLSLIPKSEDIDLKNPTDMSYVFSGAYTPLSCKLVEQVLTRGGFTGMEEITKYLPGGVHTENHVKASKENISSSKDKTGKSARQDRPVSKVVLVYFLGGCTHSEIAALRFLGKLKGYVFIIATTAIINSATMLESVMERPPI
ncbi:vacuolar protein sorting-associated protein 33B-like isoform X1 [Ostrea edulis]|uniref:vacuolar protein sorting-associated protein 33B-like isoform X1 n=1 Tax=Ostrea edulis TaxID=37623 RepID=UPI0024AF719B|nr:vacuolar protein sorting-associated protein 33B-like isoform X1 [Ostrea edulis]